MAFLGSDKFVANKQTSGRTKYLLDIALLEEAEQPRSTRPRRTPRMRRVALIAYDQPAAA